MIGPVVYRPIPRVSYGELPPTPSKKQIPVNKPEPYSYPSQNSILLQEYKSNKNPIVLLMETFGVVIMGSLTAGLLGKAFGPPRK